MPINLLRADLEGLSRRDFLKLTGAGLSALFGLPNLNLTRPAELTPELDLPCQSRVLEPTVNLFERPSQKARVILTYLQDQVYTIKSATYGNEEEPLFNRIWYEMEGGGFVHSSGLQPMQISLNPVAASIPLKGVPVQVTVPYTDAVWSIRPVGLFAYRLYYGSVFWVNRLAFDEQGQAWYRIADEGNQPIYYFARAEHLHLITADEVSPLSPEIPPNAKRVEVNLAEQVVVAYENNIPVMLTRAATGAIFPEKDLHTPHGRFYTNYKFPSSHMVHPDHLEENAYDLPGVPWVIYLTTTGVAFHGTYWHNNYGKPRSHGCVNLNLAAARWLYRWSVPSVPLTERNVLTSTGTIVIVF
jgi:hypothetical protein